VSEVYRQIQARHQKYGERWAPAALLRCLADTGTLVREAKMLWGWAAAALAILSVVQDR